MVRGECLVKIGSGEILQGHVLDILPTLPADSVDCVVTSPPYWGLRDYKIEPQIWDAVEGCEHEWGPEGLKAHGGNPNGGLAFTGTGAPETRTEGLKERVIEYGTASQCTHFGYKSLYGEKWEVAKNV